MGGTEVRQHLGTQANNIVAQIEVWRITYGSFDTFNITIKDQKCTATLEQNFSVLLI